MFFKNKARNKLCPKTKPCKYTYIEKDNKSVN